MLPTVMISLCRKAGLGVLLLLSLAVAQAKGAEPIDVVKAASGTILSKLQNERADLEKNPEALLAMVNESVVPYFDFKIISRRVLGKYWSTATDEEKERFHGEFSQFLIRFYSKSLIAFTNPRIEYSALEPKQGNSKVVSIKAEVTTDESGMVPVQFGLFKVGDTWKIIDLRIDGICLVCNYRSEYADIIRNEGLNSLIERLAEKNTAAQVS